MKKMIALILAILMIATLSGCGGSTEEAAKQSDPQELAISPDPETPSPAPSAKLETAEDYANALKDAGLPIGKIEVWTAETDPNAKLGRPNEYTSKIDFEDTTLEKSDTEYLTGGTIEVFATKDNCQSRYEYLEQFTDPSLGVIGLNQYMYKGDTVILRVSYDVVPDEAAKYETAFNALIGG